MRAIWSAAIAFGLVNVPVKVYAATEDHDLPLRQVHNLDHGRIRYERRCEVCGQIVTYNNIDKAYEDGNSLVVLTDDDLASVPADRSREIEVLQFVPTEEVDPIMFERSYYLEPDSRSPKPYLLLRETLQNTKRTAIVKFTLRQKTRLAALRVRDDVLVLQSLLWEDEVREPDFPAVTSEVQVSDAELGMAQMLVEEYSSDFTPESFVDEYQKDLRRLVEEKIATGEVTETEQGIATNQGVQAEVIDLMEALKRSIEKSRRAAGSSPTSNEASAPDSEAEPKGNVSATARKRRKQT